MWRYVQLLDSLQLCGSDVAIVIMSPYKRAFTFGHPDTDAVLDRFITEEDNNNPLATWPGNKELDKVKQDYKLSLKRLEEEKKHEEVVEKIDKTKANGVLWWDQYSIETMEIEEIEHYVKSMECVKNNVAAKIEELSVASHEASFLNRFIDQNIQQNNKLNGPLDFGSEFDDLSCLFIDTNGEGIYHGL